MDQKLIEKLIPVTKALKLYHRHKVIGLRNIPKEGPALIVVNHSLATYDISLLMAAIYEKHHRIPRSLIDQLFFKIPGLGEVMSSTGAVMGTRESAKELLTKGELVVVAPGGMREALRPSTKRYQIDWEGRYGFVRLAIESHVPIILVACPRADDIYNVYPSQLSKYLYKAFRVPFFLARGVALTPVPKPVKLVHLINKPILPPKANPEEKKRKQQIKRFHKRLVEEMTELLNKALKKS